MREREASIALAQARMLRELFGANADAVVQQRIDVAMREHNMADARLALDVQSALYALPQR
jgi:hypothetical protein